MAEKKLEGAGLRGQVAGQTALSTVGKTGKGLTYRGFAIEELAEKAIYKIASVLGVDLITAASSIVRVAEANMINALKLVSIQRGYDPRDFVLVAGGGGGPMKPAGRQGRVRNLVLYFFASDK